jgi:atypical dual specificity phosphatase
MDFHPAENDPKPEHLPEPTIPESLLAEPLAFPIAFAPSPAAQPATIDMEPEPFDLRPAAAQGFGAEDTEPSEDLPISLNRQMMQGMPLPPRAAATQLRADRAAEQLRQERAAVMRFAGGSSPGPRGFVWIEDGRLAATPMPGITSAIDHDLGLLKDAGITVLITLTEQDFPQDILAQHGLRNLHFPIADRKAPSTAETDVLVNQMHDMLDSGEVLAVHCLAGLGRTGTILAAYMVKEKGVSAQVALNQIRRFNRQFVQTADQEDFLVEYEVQQEQTVLLNRASDGTRLLK